MRMPVEHVILLCLENRSFDHMLGYLDHPDSRFAGLRDGQHTNPDGDGNRVLASPEGKPVLPAGPDHSHDAVMEQLSLAGPPWNRAPTHEGFVTSYEKKASGQEQRDYSGILSGLLAPLLRRLHPSGPGRPGRGPLVMQCLSPEQVPVLSTLAVEFAVCDHWYCSVPGETWPNRNYLHAATSAGETNIVIQPYSGPTIFDRLDDADATWRIYHDGMAQAWAFPSLWDTPERHSRWFEMSSFFEHVRAGDLPNYCFVEPNHRPPVQTLDRLQAAGAASGTSNSQHPENNLVSDDAYDEYTPPADTDFIRGERLVADIYEALRANPDLFARTVFVVTYDEHGGLYDHVPAAERVPAPGNRRDRIGMFVDALLRARSAPFDFTRLGVRVPTVVVSPLIPKGTLECGVLEHASVPATLRAVFRPGSSPLTTRDEHARTFQHLWSSGGPPRTDLPDLSAYTTLGRRPTDPAHPAARGSGPPSDRWRQGESPLSTPPATPDYFDSFITQAEHVRRHLVSIAEPEAAHLTTAASVHDGEAVARAFASAAERHRSERLTS